MGSVTAEEVHQKLYLHHLTLYYYGDDHADDGGSGPWFIVNHPGSFGSMRLVQGQMVEHRRYELGTVGRGATPQAAYENWIAGGQQVKR